MAEDTNIILTADEPTLGQIELAPQVLEIIAGIAATDVDGVASMRGSFANSVNELFGRKGHGKGVKLVLNDDELDVDIYVYLDYGSAVPKVAMAIQENVKERLLFMTDLKVRQVNVHVEGVIPEKADAGVDPNHLFDDETKENGEVK